MTQVFVSHAEEDQDIAVNVADALEERGFHTWYYERDSVPGPPYLDQVCLAIDQCKAVILIISSDSLESRQVDGEVICAYETKKPFVPMLRGIKHLQFQKQKPGWRLALGAATSVEILPTGVTATVGRIVTGLEMLGIKPTSEPIPSPDLSSPRGSNSNPSNDTICCTVFAPVEISPNTSALVHVWLHTAAQEDEISIKSTEFAPDIRRRAFNALDVSVSHGRRFSLGLDMGDWQVLALSTELTWHGGPDAVVFKVFAPGDVKSATNVGRTNLFLDGVEAASLNFKMSASVPKRDRPRLMANVRRKAYLCYSSQDRDEVLKRANMLTAIGIDCSMDVLSLRAGDDWERGLHRLIDEADIFFLFWSEAAKQSEWVKREWLYAIKTKGLDFISPIVIEQPVVPPPKELSQLHFQSSFAYLL